ncbi:MAG: cyclic nucleotide-binding domain-containing protein [Chromatiales bacterium]|nr:cyclic nucleotide-binding domain-containing protein [Chromatiales bacterium]
MDTTATIEALRHSPLTARLTDAQVAALAELACHRDLVRDEVLLTEGEVDASVHVVVTGCLAVTRDTGGGQGLTLAMLKPGDMAGALGFVDDHAHSASLRAMEPTAVCSIDRASVEQLVDRDPWLVYRLMQNIARSVHDILHRMNSQFVELNNYITKTHGRY